LADAKERVGQRLFDPGWNLADAPGDQIAEVTAWFRGKLIGKELIARIFNERTAKHERAFRWEFRGTMRRRLWQRAVAGTRTISF